MKRPELVGGDDSNLLDANVENLKNENKKNQHLDLISKTLFTSKRTLVPEQLFENPSQGLETNCRRCWKKLVVAVVLFENLS